MLTAVDDTDTFVEYRKATARKGEEKHKPR